MRSNSTITLISSILKDDSYNFRTKGNKLYFVYREHEFVSDEFLLIQEYIEFNKKYCDTVSSRLMTKLMYSEHKDIIEKRFNK